MDERMFSELATYAWNELNTKYEKEVEYNWYKIDQYHLYMLTDDIESILMGLVQDWCDDHDIDIVVNNNIEISNSQRRNL